MKKKIIPILLAAFALVISGCGEDTQSSSIITNETSIVNTTSSEDITSNISSEYSSSNAPSSISNNSSSNNTSSEQQSGSGDTNWNINVSLRGAEFRNALQAIMAGKKVKTISYSECLGVGARAAAYPTASSSTFVPFYHDASTTATTGQCNREHTWPNSRGSGKEGPGADPFIIRPTLTS